ncbi:hypothetical protein KAH81_02220 [bacterium]|nr:hypothetical protein [bacterium]
MRRYLQILILLSLTLSTAFAGRVTLNFFYSLSCEHCAEVKEEILEPAMEKYPELLDISFYEIEENIDNYEKLIEMEEEIGKTGNEIPVIFLGDSVFGGEEEFLPYLTKLLIQAEKSSKPDKAPSEEIKAIPTTSIQTTNAVSPKQDTVTKIHTEIDTLQYPVFLAYFWETGCQHCSRVTYDLQLLKERHPTLEVRDWNTDEKKAKLYGEALALRFGIEERLHLATPSVFLVDTAFISEQISFRAIDEAISRLEKTQGLDTVWNFSDDELASANQVIVERFRGLEAAPVIAAGLLDGLNPCAFGAIIFFVTFLTVVERKKREIFWVGVAFTTSIFLTYLLIGAGFLKFLQALPFLQTFAKWVYVITGVLVVGLGLLSIFDFFRSLKGQYSDMVLQLPDKLKKRIHHVIIAENEPRARRNIIIAAASTGFLVSILELACTGQVYLPTIIYVMGAPGLKAKAFLFLVLYNLMFIVPLIIVFAVVFYGTTSEQLTNFLKRNTPIIKLLTAVIFFTMAFFMWRTVLGS